MDMKKKEVIKDVEKEELDFEKLDEVTGGRGMMYEVKPIKPVTSTDAINPIEKPVVPGGDESAAFHPIEKPVVPANLCDK